MLAWRAIDNIATELVLRFIHERQRFWASGGACRRILGYGYNGLGICGQDDQIFQNLCPGTLIDNGDAEDLLVDATVSNVAINSVAIG
jgi:hypothetical protein